VRYAFSSLNQKQPFLFKLVPVLANQMAGIFPELKQQTAFVQRVIEEEEIAFLKTLETGLRRLDALEESARANGNRIDGKTAFELSDTFGFPLDLTALIAREKGLTVDEAGFQQELAQQKNRSRNAQETEQSDWTIVADTDEQPAFVGYDLDAAPARILRYRKTTAKGKTEYQVVLDQTAFYAESGGQVGDTGYLESDFAKVRVIDTKRENDLIVHTVLELPEDLTGEFMARPDVARRTQIRQNHSATHLVQAALREVLGSHVQQKGSLVNEKLLRFDFSHFTKVTDDQLRQIERLVNERIRQQIPLDERRNVPIAEAKTLGAMALFGEKYGEFVRVITFDKDFSVELCGGLHVPNTGRIGYLKITAETAVGAGVRRIEAVTGLGAEAYVDQQLDLLTQVRETLGNPQHLLSSIEKQNEEIAALRKQIEQFEQQSINQQKEQLVGRVKALNGVNFLAAQVQAGSAEALKTLAFNLRQAVPNLVAVLGAEVDGKPQLAVMLDDEIAKAGKLNASTLVRELAKEIQGGGGGQPFFATAGGKNAAGLRAAIGKAEELVTKGL
jgi:alanyl-tRNA synthetase